MPTATLRSALHTAQTPPSTSPALCPVCSGFLVPAGGQLRCTRCHFLFCEGCDGSGAEPWTASAEGGR